MLLSVALFLFRCAGGDGEPEPLRGLELHAIGQPCCYILIRFVCQQSLKGESLRLIRNLSERGIYTEYKLVEGGDHSLNKRAKLCGEETVSFILRVLGKHRR